MKALKPLAILFFSIASLLAAQESSSVRATSSIGQIMQARTAAGDFNGSVLVAREGKILYEHGFGFANLEWKIPNDAQTKFEIGSITKQFTSLLILQFVNEGKIALDGRLSSYLPYYRK